MTGDYKSEINRGIIPRAVDHIYYHCEELKAKGWKFEMKASFLEIYNEQIKDLLIKNKVNNNSSLKIILNKAKNTVNIPDLNIFDVTEPNEIHKLLNLADKNRSVAGTDANLHSSRSHSVFTLYLKCIHEENNVELNGCLSMCDLAGSERLKRSNATDKRLKETQNINKSLSSLAGVFQALKEKKNNKNKYIPIRDSKLTQILSPCFNGKGKVLMIVNVSSDHSDAVETLNTLRFAKNVNATELGKSRRNVRQM